ncbi:MAG TPA: hypothetical protein VMQ86_10095 [Bryobacteraceae bacterium]|nr:hypothetical protein [Bryobacteraceae bacterium]
MPAVRTTLTLLVALFTIWPPLTVPELPPKLLSPAYVAVTV